MSPGHWIGRPGEVPPSSLSDRERLRAMSKRGRPTTDWGRKVIRSRATHVFQLTVKDILRMAQSELGIQNELIATDSGELAEGLKVSAPDETGGFKALNVDSEGPFLIVNWTTVAT